MYMGTDRRVKGHWPWQVIPVHFFIRLFIPSLEGTLASCRYLARTLTDCRAVNVWAMSTFADLWLQLGNGEGFQGDPLAYALLELLRSCII